MYLRHIMNLYGKMVEPRPYHRFTKNKREQFENCEWTKRAEDWGRIHVDAWGYFIGLYQ